MFFDTVALSIESVVEELRSIEIISIAKELVVIKQLKKGIHAVGCMVKVYTRKPEVPPEWSKPGTALRSQPSHKSAGLFPLLLQYGPLVESTEHCGSCGHAYHNQYLHRTMTSSWCGHLCLWSPLQDS